MESKRRVNVFGLPMEVVSREEMRDAEEGTLYVMVRVANDNPANHSSKLLARRMKTLCDRCKAPCWLDPRSFDPLPAHVERVCEQCMIKALLKQQEQS